MPEGALSDVRVLDLSRVLAGPYGSMMLADLGAEVIKIEEPGDGDLVRTMPPYFDKGESLYFMSVNRGKRSVALDLKSAEGKAVFYDLVRVSDVVYDNFRAGIVEKLGLDYATLSQLNPRIICCSISGFGHDGPYRDKPAFDLILQAMGGGMSLTGEPGRPPYRMGFAIGDLGGALFAVQALLAALHARTRTGHGQRVTVSLLDCQIALHAYQVAYYCFSGKVPEPLGTGHTTAVPMGAFQTADDYIVIDAYVQRFWRQLCVVIGRPELADDPRFADSGARYEHRATLGDILAAAFRTKTSAEWLAALAEAGVPSGPINTLDKALGDPDVIRQQMVASVPHAKGGAFKAAGNPMKLSDTPGGPFQAPPLLGQHTAQVLQMLLGYSPERIAALAASGAIGLCQEQALQPVES